MSTNIDSGQNKIEGSRCRKRKRIFKRSGGKCFWCGKILFSWIYSTKTGVSDCLDSATIEHIFFKNHYARGKIVSQHDVRLTLSCRCCNYRMGTKQHGTVIDPKIFEIADKAYLKLNANPHRTKRIIDAPKILEIIKNEEPRIRLVLFGSFLGRRLIDYYLKFNQIECATDYDKYLQILSKEFADFVSECGIN